MAIIKFGPMVVGARGTLAGSTFSANASGPYVKGWSRGANPRSALQSEQRGVFSSWGAKWRDLTQAERDDWIDYADDAAQELTNSLGETYFASGFNWYVRINTHLTAAGEAERDDAPTLARPAAPVIASAALRITGAVFDSNIRMDAASPGLASNHVAFAQVVNSQGIITDSLKNVFMEIDVPDGSRDLIIQDELESAFGTIALGQRAFYSVSVQDAHGQRGPVDTITQDASA